MPSYRNRLLMSTVAIGIAAAATYFEPIPITKNWGNIAAKDMAAKVQVVDDIKAEIDKYCADGKLDPYEMLSMVASTTPLRFTEHRIGEAKLLGIFNAFDTPFPSHALEDLLYAHYNRFFSDGSRGIERGQLASYQEARRLLLKELYGGFVNKHNVSYSDFLKGRGLDTRESNETEREWINRHFVGFPIDLSTASLDKQVNAELDKVAEAFSSSGNQDVIFKEAKQAGDSKNKMYNAMLFLVSTGIGAVLAEPLKDKERRLRIRNSMLDGLAYLPKTFFEAMGDLLKRD